MSECCEDRNNFTSGFLWGIFLGAGAFWFLTRTEEGKKLRKELGKKAGEALDEIDKVAEKIKEEGSELSKKAKKIQQEIEENGPSIDDIRERGRLAIKKVFTKNGRPLS